MQKRSLSDVLAQEDRARFAHASGSEVINSGDELRAAQIEKSVLWKTDLQVVTIALVMYFLSFLDRANIGQGRLNGLQKSLNMSDHDYSIALTVLYVPYILFELPSNLLIKRITPGIWMPCLLTAWGTVATLQGLVTSKTGLYIARVFLGLTEAGILPGIALWLTSFYKPHELMVRQAIYFSGASLSGAFSGLLSVAIGKLAGLHGLAGWQWIFIIEGVFTVAVGLILFFVLPSGPANLFWLTEEERIFAIHRHRSGLFAPSKSITPEYEEHFQASEVIRAFIDPRNILIAIIGFCDAVGNYGLAFFAPTIIKTLNPHFTVIQAQLLSCPPYAAAFAATVILGIFSDRLRWRFPFVVFSLVLCVIGFAMAYATPVSRAGVRYGAIIIATVGLSSTPAAYLSWISTINAGHYKKASSIVFLVTFTNLGGIAGTWMWPTKDAPAYRPGFLVNLILCTFAILCACAVELYILRERRMKKSGQHDCLVTDLQRQGFSAEQIRGKLGDRHPDFLPML